MSKVKNQYKLVAYDKNQKHIGFFTIRTYSYDEAFISYMDWCRLVSESQCPNVVRLDFVSGNRILFSFSSLRHVVNQKNYTVNFNSY